MPALLQPYDTYARGAAVRLLLAAVATTVADGLVASVLSVTLNHSTIAQPWQGVASTLVGARAFEGGLRTVGIGLVMHFCVALAWSAVFLFVVLRASWVRRVLASPHGTLKVAALYGPAVWLVMSLVVIPVLVQRPPTISFQWWVQLACHFLFVGLPIVAVYALFPRHNRPIPAIRRLS